MPTRPAHRTNQRASATRTRAGPASAGMVRSAPRVEGEWKANPTWCFRHGARLRIPLPPAGARQVKLKWKGVYHQPVAGKKNAEGGPWYSDGIQVTVRALDAGGKVLGEISGRRRPHVGGGKRWNETDTIPLPAAARKPGCAELELVFESRNGSTKAEAHVFGGEVWRQSGLQSGSATPRRSAPSSVLSAPLQIGARQEVPLPPAAAKALGRATQLCLMMTDRGKAAKVDVRVNGKRVAERVNVGTGRGGGAVPHYVRATGEPIRSVEVQETNGHPLTLTGISATG